MTSRSDPFLVPLRGLNELVYCPRLFHLMYIQGLFDESVETLEGKAAHEKRLARGKAVKTEEDQPEALPWSDRTTRELILSDHGLGITGKFDIVLESENEVVPVEVKHGPAPDGETAFFVGEIQLISAAWNNDQIQLAAQIKLLKEAGYNCDKGKIYYRGSKTSVTVFWDENLAAALSSTAKEAQHLAQAEMPLPLMDSKKCIRCSLNHICLPDETLHLKKKCEEPRQLYPGRDDTGILHITTPGTQIGKTGESLKISIRNQKDTLIPVKDVAHICLWGNVQITTQALLAATDCGITVTYLTGGGWLRAVTTPPLTKNVFLRRQQYIHCDSPQSSLAVSRWIVSAKIANQRTLLRRNGSSKEILSEMTSLKKRSEQVDNPDSLRGMEGRAARLYWQSFPGLLKEKNGAALEMNGRNRRPPEDPVNALLSYGYAMLLRDCLVSLHNAGMDPYYGVFHAVVPGRPALALDLMEAFRPLIVDSAVLRFINEGSLSTNDFIITAGACLLKPSARKKWIMAYERRIDELVTHPLFGYRLSYRRLLSMEARLLGRYFVGETDEYYPATTR